MAQETCPSCGFQVQEGDWPFCGPKGHEPAKGVRSGEWDDAQKVVVFRKPDGTLSYPMTNAKQTPIGCEKIEIRSLSALRRFEKANNVVSHMGNYDRNGRGLDDTFKGERF